MPSDDEIERFKRRMYRRRDPQTGQEIVGFQGSSPQLTVPVMRRCQNCLHFDTDEKFQQLFRDCVERDKRTLTAAGHTKQQIAGHVRRLELGVRDKVPMWGTCLARERRTDEAAEADFVYYTAVCEQWDGRLIVSPHDAIPDEHPQEVYDRLGVQNPAIEDKDKN